MGSKGAKHVADAQPSWPKLQLLDLDDNELSSEDSFCDLTNNELSSEGA